MLEAATPRRIPRRHVIAAASQHFGCSREKLLDRRRTRRTVYRRHVAMYASRVLGGSYHQIGRAFKRDHSTVVHAVQKIGELLAHGDEKLSKDIRTIVESACVVAAMDQAAVRAQLADVAMRAALSQEETADV